MTFLHYVNAVFFILAFSSTLHYISELVMLTSSRASYSEAKSVPLIVQAIFWAGFISSLLIILKQ